MKREQDDSQRVDVLISLYFRYARIAGRRVAFSGRKLLVVSNRRHDVPEMRRHELSATWRTSLTVQPIARFIIESVAM